MSTKNSNLIRWPIALLLYVQLFALVAPSSSIYLFSVISVILLLLAWRFSQDYSICFTPKFILSLCGLGTAIVMTLVNQVFRPLNLPFASNAFVTHIGVLIQLLISICYLSSSSRAVSWAKQVFSVLSISLLPVAVAISLYQYHYYRNTLFNQTYQGGTSWFSLIVLSCALGNSSIKPAVRVTVALLSILSIVLASKRSTLLAMATMLVLQLIVYAPIFFRKLGRLATWSNPKATHILVLALILASVLSLANVVAHLSLDKLQLTFELLSSGDSRSTDIIRDLTGGRNIEFASLLKSFNMSPTDFLTSALSFGFGIGWYNYEFQSASIHNSFLLLSMLGGFFLGGLFLYQLGISFWIVICLLRDSVTKTHAYVDDSFLQAATASFAIGIDSLFSANLLVSFICLLFFFTPRSSMMASRRVLV
jgi:hypothetical protein